ncbi:MFS transporter [Albimonas pacifica]|uniref:MFS transporter, DHA1 family, bicyclomycin/chloramphenicol resistance protein n=1 Tax=Albimonas pacifica TaxID=1114924 RepID=A0A1I3DVE5_9RHOB|nr:MFS transporter [Albimonas pacifica]SFH90707.1 MFS transporter, DHA1 family, bicyclomycin/chloramphenicol resistance protein [Albimonas pacifica]
MTQRPEEEHDRRRPDPDQAPAETPGAGASPEADAPRSGARGTQAREGAAPGAGEARGADASDAPSTRADAGTPGDEAASGADRRSAGAPRHEVPAEAAGRAPRPSGMAIAAARSGGASGPADERRTSLIFVALMAALGATNAVAVDIVIPAQGLIAQSFQMSPGEGAQWTVLAMFAGASLSQLVLGPAADAWGRRRAAFLGLALAFIGGLAAAAAPTFETLIAARLLQGLGAGGLRVVSLAIIRDQSSGDRMARIVSFQALIFELIMFFTPVVGQLIVEFAHWRVGLAITALQAALTALAFHLWQPETLDPAHRRPFEFRAVMRTYGGVLRMRPAMGAAMAMAVAFGVLATFLSSAQPIFGEVYGLGWGLPAVFGGSTIFFALAALANARLVGRLGAARMARIGLASWAVSGTLGLAVFAVFFAGVPPLWLLLVWLLPTLAMFGILYGNLLATALAPLGDRAGSASSALAASGTLAGVALGAVMAEIFDGTVLPLAGMLGFAGVAGLLAMRWGGLGREVHAKGEA